MMQVEQHEAAAGDQQYVEGTATESMEVSHRHLHPDRLDTRTPSCLLSKQLPFAPCLLVPGCSSIPDN